MGRWDGNDRRKPVDSGNRLILEVPKGSNLDEVLRLFARGDNKQVLEAINNLTNFVKEKFMGLKEDNETLNSRMGEVETAVDAIAADVSALKDELKEANERANIDLSPQIARAESIAARLTGIAGPNAGSDPEPEPTV